MSTRRPLANVPNATNSPHRAGLVPAKRPRTTNAPIDIPYGQPPPKKQVIDGLEQDARSPARVKSSTTDCKLFTRRSTNAQPSAFEKKLVAARDRERQAQLKGTKPERPSAESVDSIRQWQRHYRKAFPQFVFYFDAIPEDIRAKCSRQVIALGASEEKFFSRDVTHVVTSRPIPPEIDTVTPAELNATSADQTPVDTVNPSLLEKTADTHLHMSLKTDPRREQSNMDVLYRARRMKMKIWALEKLQRMIAAINDGDPGGHIGNSRNHNAVGANSKARGETDLSQVLRKELINGPSDRDPLSSLKELVMFKGPFIYIHDMDEKTKPVMVREYPKVARRQDGIWPQFRSAPLGKCPFIDEPPSKKEIERQRARQKEEKKTAPIAAPVKEVPKFDAPDLGPVNIDIPDPTNETRPDDNGVESAQRTTPEDVQRPLQTKPESPRKSSESFVPPPPLRTGPFYAGREPAASGMQPSNITSAIRSQMVSSTAAAPGAKAGLSKEVHELKRKVLEKSNGGLSTGTMLSPHPSTSTSATLKLSNYQSNKLCQANTQEKLGHVQEEDATQSEENGAAKRRTGLRKVPVPKKKERRRDPKPGYCENCRDKFDDFEEHVMTRKHRKFATNKANWADLDALLEELERPLKDEYDYEDAATP
ncbi:hypothetical protein CNMCM5793_007318 [Aspergillus hiratsukae]|uniref:DBF4-type domain-containing protein n=1 Tax=Aspergillus hiratsukae TaxID=1194566 RepID=A0A8H6Q8J0_9EURO|nr:hypothetical protein CNMCM5793_007318 [Aspergillus hiratsukae]KAF7167988.1 hypothetical protein CNMCM6106_003310 [Aspergillus hiratsukae]